MITNTVHFISMRTKTAWGNTLSLHRERQRAVCPFVYTAAFGHFLPATSAAAAAAAVSRGRRFLQEEAAEPGGRQHRRIEADIARGMILQKYGVQKQVHAASQGVHKHIQNARQILFSSGVPFTYSTVETCASCHHDVSAAEKAQAARDDQGTHQ